MTSCHFWQYLLIDIIFSSIFLLSKLQNRQPREGTYFFWLIRAPWRVVCITVHSGYTYIYIIGHYNPSVRTIDLVSHTTCVVCVNFIHKWRDLQFKVDSKRQIFWHFFHGNFIYSQSFHRRNTFCIFVLMSGLGLEPWLYV